MRLSPDASVVEVNTIYAVVFKQLKLTCLSVADWWELPYYGTADWLCYFIRK